MTVTNAHLQTESGVTLETESGQELLVEAQLYSLPTGVPDVRITVLSPSARQVLMLDASGDLAGDWTVRYEKTPGGCGAGSVQFALRYEEAFERGYCTGMNIVEISTGDDVLQQSCSYGATKLYVTSTIAYGYTYNSATESYGPNGEATQQIYLWDGTTLTMRIPVTGAGEDAGGNYITIGSPLAGGGNPTTLPAYAAGGTIIGRRRYAGLVARRDRPKQQVPMTTMTLGPLAQMFDLTEGSYSIDPTMALDVGTVIYGQVAQFGLPGAIWSTTTSASSAVGATSINVASTTDISAGVYIMLDYGLPTQEMVVVASVSGSTVYLTGVTLYAHASGAAAQNIPRWPHFVIKQSNFPTTGQTFSGTRTGSSFTSMLSDFMGAIASGDIWSLIVDHDRAPKLVKLYTLATNTYSYPVTLTQGQVDFEPLTISVQDQDTSNIANAVLVTGGTNSVTQQPYNAQVVDLNSIAYFDGMQFDAQPVSNSSLMSDTACASFGYGTLAQYSLPQEQATFRVYTRIDTEPSFEPQGIPAGDAVRGTDGVTLMGFDQVGVSANNCPDSEFLTSGLWTIAGFTQIDNVGPGQSNTLQLTANGSASALSPPIYVAPNRPFSPGCYVNAQHVTSGTVVVNLLVNGEIVASTVTATNGAAASTIYPPFGFLPAGSNILQLQIVATNVVLSGGSLVISQPMIADGGFPKPYVPNYGAPNVYGLVSSAATTLTAHGDRYQDITFQPIEPDWNSAIAEAGNALAAQIRLNAAPGTAIGAYTLSTTFFPLSYTGTSLVVTVPVALAIFAKGTNPVVVGGNTFTLPPNATTWVWLNPGNTYTTVGNASTVSGAILLGFFTTSAAGIDGFTQKASVGLVTLTQAQLPSMGSEATAAPILTSVGSITYPVVGNGTYDASCTFNVDQVGQPWEVGLALFAVAAGDVTDDPRDFPYGIIPVVEWSGATVRAVWTGIGAGNSKDLYCAYIDGQGRLSLATKVGTTNANQAGTTAILGVPTTPPNPTASPTAFAYANNGGGTYDASCTVTLDGNGTYNNNGLAEIECVMAPHASGQTSTSTGWTPSGNPQLVNGTGIYVCDWGGCGVQVAYDVGIRYIGQNGSRSYVYIIGTTTAAQLAQLPFQNVIIDPSTGYIIVSDAAIHPTYQTYSLNAAGIGSLLSASWSFRVGSTSVNPTIWLFYTSSGGDNGYIADWIGNIVSIYKVTGSSYVLLSSSTISVTKDATNFHNLEFIASQRTAGTVNLVATLDGLLMCSASDSSSPYTSGEIATQFRDAVANNFIDEKTVEIEMGGDPSSASLSPQGSLVPTTLPAVNVYVASPTYSLNPGERIITLGAETIQLADGSSVSITNITALLDYAGANGVWYVSVALVLATLTPIYYLSQTAPSPSTLMTYVSDGVLPLVVGQSLTVTAGNISGLTPGSGITRRYTQ